MEQIIAFTGLMLFLGTVFFVSERAYNFFAKKNENRKEYSDFDYELFNETNKKVFKNGK